MKGITVTENNIDMVFGKIAKFFTPNGKCKTTNNIYDFWCDFTCGKNNRVKPHFRTQVKLERVTGHCTKSGIMKLIEIMGFDPLDRDRGTFIKIGDKVAFCGNRIVICNKNMDDPDAPDIKNAYVVFQVENMYTQKDVDKFFENMTVITKKPNGGINIYS